MKIGLRCLGTTLLTLPLAAMPVAGIAQATAYKDAPPLLLGAAWYPEQWDEATWERDLTRMEAANIHLARITEFAWSAMEPTEGNFQLDWVERAIAAAAKHHVYIVLGTPSAAPPAWLTQKYPEVLNVDNNGHIDEHGNRQQFSFASPKYRQLAARIAEKMAVRFGHNPNVVGWQLDNEYARDSFDVAAKQQFHEWLKKKYGTIEKLNDKWTTSYWSQTYNDFEQIPVHSSDENPALLLEWKRFVSDTWKSYSQNQIDVIRPHVDKRQFITTNTMGWFDGFDEYVVHQNLDIAAWDDYANGDPFDWNDNAARHDLTRGFKRKNFWVMETQPAFVNWHPVNTTLNKGQVREMAWQAIGHGAEAVEYWQWRSALNGQEQYHGVVVGADGEPVPAYDEIKQIGAEFIKAGPSLAGTSPKSEVGLLHSYDSRWAINFQRHNRNFDPVAEFNSFYSAFHNEAQSVDVISPFGDLSQYKLLVAPALNVISAATAAHLKEYVEKGGNLVLGPRSGMKDEWNALWTQRQPGPLTELLGGRVDQFYALSDKVPVSGEIGTGTASIWADQLKVSSADTRILATYGKSNGWLDGQPAIVTRKVGKGSITYIGAWLDDAMLAQVATATLNDAGVKQILPTAPHGVEVCRRTGANGEVLVLINHNTAPASIALGSQMQDLLKGGQTGQVELEPYGVAVLKR